MIIFNDIILMYCNSIVNNEFIYDNSKDVLIGLYQMRYYIDIIKEDVKQDLLKNIYILIDNLLIDISQHILNMYPDKFNDIVNKLEKEQEYYENLLKQLGETKFRDHLKHSKRNYWMGLLLYPFLKEKKLSEKDKDIWFIISRFHDYCYIIQKIRTITQRAENKIKITFPNMNFKMETNISLGSYFTKHKQLEIMKLIQNRYLEFIPSPTFFSFLEQLESREHAVLSALFVYDMFHQDKIDQVFDEEDLKTITRSITLHGYSLTKPQIQCENDFFAGLLILVDELQEWNRPLLDENSYKTDHLFIENINIEIKDMPKIKYILESLLMEGEHKIDNVNIGNDIQYEEMESKLVVIHDDDKYEIYMEVNITPGLTEDIKQEKEVDVKVEVKKRAEEFAEKFISKLDIIGDPYDLGDIDYSYPQIVSERSTNESIILKIPLYKKIKGYPIIININLVRHLIVNWILKNIDEEKTNFPQVTFPENETPIIFTYPNYETKWIPAKQFSLKKIDRECNWKVEIFGLIGPEKGKVKIFPENAEGSS